MKHLINRAYARERLVSFQRTEERQRRESAVWAAWTAAWLIVVVALLLAGVIGK